MEAYRVIKKPKKRRLVISVPENMGDMELEVIVLPVEKEKQNRKFDPLKYKGIWKDKNIDVEKTCRGMRTGWERNI